MATMTVPMTTGARDAEGVEVEVIRVSNTRYVTVVFSFSLH